MAMMLSELLDELRGNLLRDVSDQVSTDTQSDYLWSDKRLIQYINEAQRRFARRSLCIQDSTSAATSFTTVDQVATGQASYPLDPSIIAVLSVKMTGDRQDLVRAGHWDLNAYSTPDFTPFDPSTMANMPPGKPLAWTTDESGLQSLTDGSWDTVNLTLYPQVTSPYNGIVGRLRVIRLPLNALTASNMSAYPEIPEHHHLDMLDWAAYLALRAPDTDVAGAGAFQRAQAFAQSFEAHCKDCRQDVMRRMFRPIQWGFGRNGWSWEL